MKVPEHHIEKLKARLKELHAYVEDPKYLRRRGELEQQYKYLRDTLIRIENDNLLMENIEYKFNGIVHEVVSEDHERELRENNYLKRLLTESEKAKNRAIDGYNADPAFKYRDHPKFYINSTWQDLFSELSEEKDPVEFEIVIDGHKSKMVVDLRIYDEELENARDPDNKS